MLAALFNFLFRQPAMPPISLPLPVRMIPGVRATISQAFTLAYERGVYDGLVAGILLSLLLLPTLRSQVIKGASNVLDHI